MLTYRGSAHGIMDNERTPKKLSQDRLLMFNKPGHCSPKLQKKTADPLKQPKAERHDGSPLFQAPMKLTETIGTKIQCNPDTLAELNKIEKTVNVVSIVGTLRSGKSFLSNKLAQTEVGNPGFEMGHSSKAVTKGIWVMCRPHPTQENQVLVLLDTEGNDDPKKVDISDDQSLFVLSTLLSSTMVYNAKGNFDRGTIEKFKFLTKIKESVKVSGTEEDDSILDFFFPTFVLALRDFTLKLESKPDEFLEENLKLQQGTSDSIRNFNTPRRLIRRYFKKRRCFIFTKPVKGDHLSNLMSIPEKELKEPFRVALNEFRNYVYSCGPKALKSGKGINGRMLVSLLINYVNSINNHDMPCILEAMEHMAEVENAQAIAKASQEYDKMMKKMISVHSTPGDAGLVSFHKESMKSAMEILKQEAMFDDISIFHKQVGTIFEQHLNRFKATVDKNSTSRCLEKLRSLDMRIRKKINNRAYCHPSGYDEYVADIDWIIKQYKKHEPYFGSKARESLQEYLDNKEDEEEQVYQMVLKAQEGNKTSIHRKVTQIDLGEAQTQEAAEETKRKQEEDSKLIKEINHSLIMVQRDGLKSIGEQYLEMLNLKIKESESIARELSPNDPYYAKLKQETEYWRKIMEKASADLESIENDTSPLQRQPADGEDQDNNASSREQIPKLQRDQLLVGERSAVEQPGGKMDTKTETKKFCKIQ